MGIGVSVIPGITIGEDCVIGAGASVIDDVPPGVVSVGVPARVVRVNGKRVPAAASISGATQVDPCEACLKQLEGRFLDLERRIEELQARLLQEAGAGD